MTSPSNQSLSELKLDRILKLCQERGATPAPINRDPQSPDHDFWEDEQGRCYPTEKGLAELRTPNKTNWQNPDLPAHPDFWALMLGESAPASLPHPPRWVWIIGGTRWQRLALAVKAAKNQVNRYSYWQVDLLISQMRRNQDKHLALHQLAAQLGRVVILEDLPSDMGDRDAEILRSALRQAETRGTWLLCTSAVLPKGSYAYAGLLHQLRQHTQTVEV